MTQSIYLINPACDFPSYYTAETFAAMGLTPTIMVADLALPTLAGMLGDRFDINICDQSVAEVEFDSDADYIGITGKISQWGNMREVAERFRALGKTVIIGGSYASLSPDTVRPHCDVLVRGEIEEIVTQLADDLLKGELKKEYFGTKPELSTSPLPDWTAYPNERALIGTVQTSRGCPFECEFCDVIEYLGRKQRHKPIDQVLAELDNLYALGYRQIFLADDNFTVYRARCKELLRAIRGWNQAQTQGKVFFSTQASIDAARDDEVLRLCGEAGLSQVFIGIETPNEDSLKETGKRQNLKRDLVADIQRFYDFGITVQGGMIVGFDSDGPDIFQRQYDFAMAAAIPTFTIGMLVAPEATRLHQRLTDADRLLDAGAETAATPWSTNIVPERLTQQQLNDGMQWLCNRLYSPQGFEQRVNRFIERFGERLDPRWKSGHSGVSSHTRRVDLDAMNLVMKVRQLGAEEAAMWSRISKKLRDKPQATEPVMGMMIQYLQARHMYSLGQFWEPHLADAATPQASAA